MNNVNANIIVERRYKEVKGKYWNKIKIYCFKKTDNSWFYNIHKSTVENDTDIEIISKGEFDNFEECAKKVESYIKLM